MVFGFIYLVEGLTTGCSVAKRIVTPQAALSFGKDHIRQDKRFWESIGVSSPDEIDSILNPGCCSAGRGDYFINDNDRWRVFISAERRGHYDFQYEVFFSECRTNVRVEKLATRY
jgi:hypothetical protein